MGWMDAGWIVPAGSSKSSKPWKAWIESWRHVQGKVKVDGNRRFLTPTQAVYVQMLYTWQLLSLRELAGS